MKSVDQNPLTIICVNEMQDRLTVERNRRINMQLEKEVEESISIAENLGILSAFLHMVKGGIPEDIIKRLLRGEQLRASKTQTHH